MHGNLLIDSLPIEIRERLHPHFEKVMLPSSENVIHSGDLHRYVYFPLDAVFYLFTTMENGATLETVAISFEGVVGLSVFFGAEVCSYYATVANSCRALRISAAAVKEEFDRGGSFQKAVLRYVAAFFVQVSQTAARNRVHTLDKRVCRWLLMMSDRVKSGTLHVTHEFIARMLCCQRSYVTAALSRLQKEEVIRCSREKIKILNRRRLEDCACECHLLIENEFSALGKYVSALNGLTT